MRPVLSPAARRLWRDQETLQLGRAPDRAAVLAGLDPAARAVLALLAGTRDLAAVRSAALQAGCPADRADALLGLLQAGGLLVDAADRWPDRLELTDRDRLAADVASLTLVQRGSGLGALGRRDRAAVVVLGAGRIGAPLAALLCAAGVGTVDVSDDGRVRSQDLAVGGLELRDVGRRRGEAVRDRLRSDFPATRTGPVPRPDLVVLAPAAQLDELDPPALTRSAVPHLLAEVRDTVGVVGPLVLPGASACLHCVDLDRSERDPHWPVLAAQLSSMTRSLPACDSALAAAVTAQAALQVLALLDGSEPASVDGSLELALPDWRWRRRSRRPHAACECRWRATA